MTHHPNEALCSVPRTHAGTAVARLAIAVALLLAALGRSLAQNGGSTPDATSRFTPVTSAGDLADGATVVIGNAAYGMLLGKAEERNRRKAVAVAFADGRPTAAGSDVQLVTLRRRSGGWRLEVGEGRCLAATASSTQVLKAVPTGSGELTIADIAIDPVSADATIAFRGSVAFCTNVRFSPNGFFWCYASPYSVEPVQIYRLTPVVPELTLSADPSAGAAPDDLTPYADATVERLTLHRTLASDGGWHTLCLPFALTAADISGPLCGAEVEEPAALSRTADGRVVVSFRRVGSTVAGRPYLVRVPATVCNPVFRDKTLTALTPLPASLTLPGDGSHAALSVTMHGIYAPALIEGTAYRFLSADGLRLAVPDGSGALRPYRAYFAVGTSADTSATSFAVAHADGAATAVAVPRGSLPSAAGVSARYTLQGVPLPPGAVRGYGGIVVVGGRKFPAKSLVK